MLNPITTIFFVCTGDIFLFFHQEYLCFHQKLVYKKTDTRVYLELNFSMCRKHESHPITFIEMNSNVAL